MTEPVRSEYRPDAGESDRTRPPLELPDDRFVPVHCRDLVDAIADDTDRFGSVARDIATVADQLETVIDQETTSFQRQLDRRYERFNPARETVDVGRRSEADVDELRGLIAYLLDKANYERLEERQLESALAVKNSHGIRIRVDPERVDALDLYVRGQTVVHKRIRTLRAPIRGRVETVEVYRRLAVVFRERGSAHLNLKLFRDIPTADVEALLPHAEVEMSHWDRIKVVGYGLGALGGVGTKSVTAFVGGTFAAGQLMWAGIAAFFGLSLRSVLGYRRAKYLRTSQMTHNLYYQNVANDAGVLSSLLSNIAQEELKEATVAYAMLAARPEIASSEQLDTAVEAWLSSSFDIDVDFDGADAIETLDRLGLWADRNALRVVDPSEAVRRLVDHGARRLSTTYHFDAWARRE